MTTTLIVLAHPEPRSFNATWADATARASEALGHTVLRSDLCAMGFDPVERAAHHPGWPPGAPFDPLKAQEQAAATEALPADVAAEIAKLRRADRVIVHFPLWWFAPPAVLKGWLDRVFAHGALHDVDHRFDCGPCRGKKVLFCVTTGSSAAESAHNGKEGDIALLLWPTAYAFRYLGFTVLAPEVIHGVHGYQRAARKAALEARLRRALDGQPGLVEGFDTRAVLPFNGDDDFDADGRLKPGHPCYTPFIRHAP